MKLSEITSILNQATLSPLSRNQLLELTGTKANKSFEAALFAFNTGNQQRRDELEATVDILDEKRRATLQRIGGQLPVGQLVAVAYREQRRFFDAIDAIENRTTRTAAARSYLVELDAAARGPDAAQSPAADPPCYSLPIFESNAALCVAKATNRTDRKYTIDVERAVALAGGARKTFD